MNSSPLEQFRIKEVLGSVNLGFTNCSFVMMVTFLVIVIASITGTRKHKIMPGILQVFLESVYSFIKSVVVSNLGNKGVPYVNFVFSIFIFLSVANVLSLVPMPHEFTVMAQISTSFTLSLIVFFVSTISGFRNKGVGFLKIFVPSGVPKFILPIISFIEVFSYLSRPISLSIRLSANMMAGHTVIEVVGSFVDQVGIYFSFLPFLFVALMIAFEMFVSVLQAYIYASLTCVYLSDAVSGH